LPNNPLRPIHNKVLESLAVIYDAWDAIINIFPLKKFLIVTGAADYRKRLKTNARWLKLHAHAKER